jgi:uncharacterized repeat protein (TIGR03803 family)
VFRLKFTNGNWVLNTLYTFNGRDGDTPQARVVFGPGGILYGTTPYGGAFGYGTVYSLGPPARACVTVNCPWKETVLYSFAIGTDGNVYGTTWTGGGDGCSGRGCGVVFEITP